MVDRSLTKIGRRLRQFREEAELSLRQLSELSDVSMSSIQKIEGNSMVPSIAVLMKLARGLGIRISAFVKEDGYDGQVKLKRKGERRVLRGASDEIKVEYISSDLTGAEIFAARILLAPGANSGEDFLFHGGDELAICEAGTIEFNIDGEKHLLRPGDSVHFKAHLPHSWRNPGRGEARMMMVCSRWKAGQAVPEGL